MGPGPYHRRPSPLHAARASVGCAWCAALAAAALVSGHPGVLAAVLVAALGAAWAAGAGREVGGVALRLGLPLAVLIAVVNVVVSREGLTVIFRVGEIPPLGRVDLTLEAAVYGGVLGLRALALVCACALYAVAVDPDEVLRLFRRAGFRSALTATIATRMVGVLAADGRRLADGQRCRPGEPASRVALVRAVASGALDRATDVAAALEVRGYGAARRPPRAARRPWSRHDLAFAASAAALAGLTVAGTQVAGFDAYPSVDMAGGWGPALVSAGIVACALAPFADRRGVAR